MALEPKLEGDINKFYDQASKDIGSLIAGSAKQVCSEGKIL